MNTLLVIGGAVVFAFFIFHLFFWKIFDWKRDLKSLTPVNRAIMQVLNLCLSFVFLLIAYISIFHKDELLNTSLGKTMLLGISIFWLLRALEQIMFFGLKSGVSIAFFVVFLAGSALYLIPFIGS